MEGDELSFQMNGQDLGIAFLDTLLEEDGCEPYIEILNSGDRIWVVDDESI